MISLFKNRSALSVFWLIIICFGLHIDSLLHPPTVEILPGDGYFYYLLKSLQNAQPYFASLLFILVVFLLAMQLNFVMNALHMYPKQTHTAALAFILFTALLPQFNVLSTALFTCNFFIWILYSACKLYGAHKPKTSIYNFGLLCGITVLLYFPSLPLIIIAFMTLAIIRPLKINEWFVLFFGIITPAYFLTAYFFLTGQLKMLPRVQNVFHLIVLPVPTIYTIITFAVATLVMLWGIFSVQNSGSNVLIQVRKSWMVFFIAIVLMLPVIFFVTNAYPMALLLLAVPGSAYVGFAFGNSRTILPVIFFWILISLAIYNNWFANY